jgi:multidrug efflux system outer membrane protein
MTLARSLAAGIALAVLAGCTMEPHYQRPAAPVPPTWPQGPAYSPADRSVAAAAPGWHNVFRDPRLQKLIGQGLASNRDLAITMANVAAARAQYRIQRAQILPTIDGNAGYSYATRLTTDGKNVAQDTFSADVGTAAFEIDLFGRIRSLNKAALNRYLASEAGAHAVRLTLAGDIADLWLQHAADQSLLRIAEETVGSAERSVELTSRRLQGGIAPRTDLRQAEQILSIARADVARQRMLLAIDVNALQQVVGIPIDPALLPDPIETAGETLGQVPAGLDSAVLLQRPDVLEAEYVLRAANAEIGAARAALFPRIALTSMVGFASNALSALFDGDSFAYNVSPSATYPIFRGGAGRNNVRLSEAQRDAALAGYQRSIQNAFREVSDALARRGTIFDELAATQAQVASADDTFRLVTQRYRGGIDTFLASLDAERSLYTAQRTLVGIQLERASNLVALYRALGADPLLDPATPLPAAAPAR